MLRTAEQRDGKKPGSRMIQLKLQNKQPLNLLTLRFHVMGRNRFFLLLMPSWIVSLSFAGKDITNKYLLLNPTMSIKSTGYIFWNDTYPVISGKVNFKYNSEKEKKINILTWMPAPSGTVIFHIQFRLLS